MRLSWMLDLGAIEPSVSPYASFLVVVKNVWSSSRMLMVSFACAVIHGRLIEDVMEEVLKCHNTSSEI